jgi:hypothetical protein
VVDPLTELIAFCRADKEGWALCEHVARELGYRAIEELRGRWVDGYSHALPASTEYRVFTTLMIGWLEAFCIALAEGRYIGRLGPVDDSGPSQSLSPALFRDATLAVVRGRVRVLYPDNRPTLRLIGIAKATLLPPISAASVAAVPNPAPDTPPPGITAERWQAIRKLYLDRLHDNYAREQRLPSIKEDGEWRKEVDITRRELRALRRVRATSGDMKIC